MIKNVFFDLDDTILDFHKAEKNALTDTLIKIGVQPQKNILSRYSELNLAQWKLLERGLLTREQVKTRRFSLLFDEIGVDFPADRATAIYESFLGKGHFFIDGAPELLQSLFGQYRLYLASNGTANVQKGRIESAGIEKYFDDIFVSQYIGYNKPSIEFFNRCFEKIPNFKKEESIIIGDSLTSDILGGKNAGISTVWFNPRNEENRTDILPDFQIHKLCEAEKIITCI